MVLVFDKKNIKMAKAWPQEFQMFTRWETRLFGFVLILLTINASAKIDSVLEVIPNTAVGLIHVDLSKYLNFAKNHCV